MVDLVHSSPIVGHALRDELHHEGIPTGMLLYAWADLVPRQDGIGSHLVVDAYLDDHVPLSLKVRALAAVGVQIIVLGTTHQTSLVARAFAEGAAEWIEPRESLNGTVDRIRAVIGGEHGACPVRHAPSPVRLTDREVQILCLYASRRSISARTLARYLGITEQTVNTHLKSGRGKYRAAGCPVGSRSALAAALVEDGHLVAAATWQAEHRW